MAAACSLTLVRTTGPMSAAAALIRVPRTAMNGYCPLSSGAYALPASNTFGNYPINTLIGPLFINQDLSLSKSFAITERMHFTLRGDATNAFNHTNLGSPNADIQRPTLGKSLRLPSVADTKCAGFSSPAASCSSYQRNKKGLRSKRSSALFFCSGMASDSPWASSKASPLV